MTNRRIIIFALSLLAVLALVGIWHYSTPLAPADTTAHTAAKSSNSENNGAPASSAITLQPLVSSPGSVHATPATIAEVFSAAQADKSQTASTAIKVSGMLASGDKGPSAVIQVNGDLKKLKLNTIGEFDQINVGPKQTIPIALSLPDRDPGQKISVQVEDGGYVGKGNAEGKGDIVEVLPVNDNHQIVFAFTTNNLDGVYRIAVAHGADVQVFKFWVGQPLVYKN